MKILIKLLINAIALAAAAWLIDGIHYEGLSSLLLVALLFGLVNAIIRPLVTILAFPLVLLTLGLFLLVINGLMLYFTSWIAGFFGLRFWVDGLIPAFLGALVVSLVSLVLSLFLHPSRERD